MGGGVSYDRLSREEKVLSPHFLACLVTKLKGWEVGKCTMHKAGSLKPF